MVVWEGGTRPLLVEIDWSSLDGDPRRVAVGLGKANAAICWRFVTVSCHFRSGNYCSIGTMAATMSRKPARRLSARYCWR